VRLGTESFFIVDQETVLSERLSNCPNPYVYILEQFFKVWVLGPKAHLERPGNKSLYVFDAIDIVHEKQIASFVHILGYDGSCLFFGIWG
jgi:hypothetical protein